MKPKRLIQVLIVLNLIVLIISTKLFWNMGVYVDEAGSTPSLVTGGDFWILMDWLRLLLLGIIPILLFIIERKLNETGK